MAAEGTFQDQIQWLIRKNGLLGARDGVTVLGPYLTDQVREMLRSGMLEENDELCPENSYWFDLRELTEVKRFLGMDRIVLAKHAAADQEPTQPDFETTDPDFAPSRLKPSEEETPSGVVESEATSVIDLHAMAKPAASAAKNKRPKDPPPTAQDVARQFRRVLPHAPLAYSNPAVGESTRGKSFLGLEKGRLISLLIVVGLIVAGLGVLWVIKSFKG